MAMRNGRVMLGVLLVGTIAQAETAEEILRRDWLRQAELRFSDEPNLRTKKSATTCEADAAGAVDGVADEPWGFHTGLEENPWWQVDLQAPVKLDRVVVHNRSGGVQDRAATLGLLVSSDGKAWREAHRHNGSTFGSGGAALTIPCGGCEARYVRVQLAAKQYLHLNEVQVYAVGSPENAALRKPATQSSLSEWSVDHAAAPKAKSLADAARESLARGEKLAAALRSAGVDVAAFEAEAKELKRKIESAREAPDGATTNREAPDGATYLPRIGYSRRVFR